MPEAAIKSLSILKVSVGVHVIDLLMCCEGKHVDICYLHNLILPRSAALHWCHKLQVESQSGLKNLKL